MTMLYTKAKELMEKDFHNQQVGSLQQVKVTKKAKGLSDFFKRKTKK